MTTFGVLLLFPPVLLLQLTIFICLLLLMTMVPTVPTLGADTVGDAVDDEDAAGAEADEDTT